MQSAFVDIGLERDGFLYVTDVVSTSDQFEQLEAERRRAADAGRDGEPADDARRQRRRPRRPGKAEGRRNGRASQTIDQLLKEGQEVLVQVVKEPLGTKGARITCHASIPGRFLVFMPTVDHVGVSRKIESRDERGRLRGIVRQFREQHGFTGGIIIRTAAAGRPEGDILGDLNDFLQIWQEIRQRVETTRAPSVIYREQSLVAKLLRDLLTDEYQTIRIDSLTEYRKVQQLVERIMPALLPRVKLYTKDYPIFEEYGVRNEIDKALRSKVWLKSGGYIVINQTEALVAIDVNTGRYVGKKTGRLEDTIVKTNLEATKEIVRQLRLRDLGRNHRARLHRHGGAQEPPEGLPGARAGAEEGPVAVEGDSGLGVRAGHRHAQAREAEPRAPADRPVSRTAPGTGTVKSTATICFDILTELRKVSSELNGHGVLLRVNPEIAKSLQGEEQGVLRDLERAVGRKIHIKADVGAPPRAV